MTLPAFPNRWPLFLAILGVVILSASLWYTNRLANQLAVIEEGNIELYANSMERISRTDSASLTRDVSTETEVIELITTVPRMLTDGRGVVTEHFGYEGYDSLELAAELKKLVALGREPIELYGTRLYFGESTLRTQLRYFPLVLTGFLLAFLLFALYGVYHTKRSEQNRVWVGLAKETAHQLGTPISAIVGWVEFLRASYADDPDLMEVTEDLDKDVKRLSMVANRFSKIGANPELKPVNVYEKLDEAREYMEKRAPRRVKFAFPSMDIGNAKVAINPLLFDWVIENLLRNALDAMEGKGTISGAVREFDNKIMIDISDTGKGIEPKNIRKVFNPGFTTKTRGWGLGLSLVKRIIEQYHRGKIVVSKSEVGKGTTFTITLPRV